MHVGALGLEIIDTQVQARAAVELLDQRPKLLAQLVFEGLNQPLGKVVAVALHQVGLVDFFASVQPGFFLVTERTAQKIAGAVKAQNRQAALFGAAARGRQVVKKQLFTQHRVDGFSHGGAFAGAQAFVITEKARHCGVCRMFEAQCQAHQFGAGV